MRILLVEDEPGIAAHLRRALTDAGYVVDGAADGEEAWFLGDTEPYDAVVLDLGLPKQDGLSVLRAWRSAGRAFPVLILTARGSWREKVEGIDAGADDYLAKPFAVEELLARLRALLRRTGGHASPVLRHGAIELDTRTARVTLDGAPVALTALEYRILAYLMHQPGRVVSQAELTEHVYAQDFERDSNIIEVIVGRLRRKLGRASIVTVRGLGYRLGDAP
jgi:two-component system OmpR family response regulator